MCGIAGIHNLDRSRPVDQRVLSAMISMLHHRGPDGVGYHYDRNIGLGHARLSIIDLAGGTQPIHNEDKTIWVTFNGEIFNYIELRSELELQGHSFYTHSDTEVIVHLYEQHGLDFVQRLNGQFAIALWDAARQELLLMRDRPGILPLFYMQDGDRIAFASEIKALLPAMKHAPSLDIDALDQLLTFWSPVSPATMFSGVRSLGPGEMLRIKDGVTKIHTYWDWTFPEDGEYRTESEESLRDELHDLLIDATRIRLRADVPVGAYLSGGLDSSVLVALIHHYGNTSLRTFSIGFDETSHDERPFQQAMIRHLGAEHSEILCKHDDISKNLMPTIWHTEMPILRTAPIPMGQLSGLVRAQNYKVVLTGEGSDEVFGGYDIFKESKIRRFWANQPQSRIRPILLKRLYPYLDISGSQSQTYLQSFFGAGIDSPGLTHFSHLPRWATTAKCKEFFSDEVRTELSGDALDRIGRTFPSAISRWHPFSKAQYIEAKSLMAGYLLSSQGDRMLMMNSVEGRFPYLDHRVIEFANRLPPRLKMKVLNEKYILKRAMKQYLPESILSRYKQPYRAPDIPSFFSDKTPTYVDELMSAESLKRTGYFDANKVGFLLQKIKRGRAIGNKDNMAFVAILSTQMWHHHFVDKYFDHVKPLLA